MMKFLRAVIAAVLLLSLSGCAGSLDSMRSWLDSGPWWRAAQADGIRARARELEARNELAMALDHWRLVQHITADTGEAQREIARLRKKIAGAVKTHYRQGLAALGKKAPTAARNHFLAALRLNPGYEPALRQIRSRFSPFPLMVYQCKAGDRPASVAGEVYADENKAFLVAWFNRLPEDRPLKPGSVLILPNLGRPAPPPKAREEKAEDPLAEARNRLVENDLEGALASARQADAPDADVQALIHTIHLQLAQQRIEALQLEDAADYLAMVPDGFEGKATLAANLESARQQQELDQGLARAREAFAQGLYARSLDQAEQLLELASDSREAAELAAESRYRLALDDYDHKRYLEARAVLAGMEPGHAAGAALKEKVHDRLVELAQIHYRNGVKHFINEDLEKAIAEWETALTCDPEHAKARENIANARRIQQKLKALP